MLIASDLLLSEHRETADPEAFTFDVPIDRGELITDGLRQITSAIASRSQACRRACCLAMKGRPMSPPATSMTSRDSDQR